MGREIDCKRATEKLGPCISPCVVSAFFFYLDSIEVTWDGQQ